MSERARPTRAVPLGIAAGVVVGAALTAAVVLFGSPSEASSEGEELVASARNPAAMVALAEGGLRYGERLSGRVREVDENGDLAPDSVAEVEVTAEEEDQRGLLGLAVDDEDRTFAAWVDGDTRLVVGQVAPGRQRLVWEGPEVFDRAVGGHLTFTPDGELLVGVGDQEQPEAAADPDEPFGKLLLLDPEGDPDQEPEVLSAGWNNPFAFAYTEGGALWVADNAPGSRPERLARGDGGPSGPSSGEGGGQPTSVTELPDEAAPSGLAALSEDRIAVCGYASNELRIYDVSSVPAGLDEGATVEGCNLAVVVLADGELAVSDTDTIRTLEVPG